ncbi:MAG: SpoIIE family protein phosphatase [Clostridia bacterium]|nr:SpoIIE family protein phosphatase [Clostridia bacterium]
MDITKEDLRSEGRLSERGRALITDAVFMLVSFLFARCHTLFGARPLALALISALPTHLFSALAGAVIGSLSLGREGVVLSLVLAISLFLRLAISGGSQRPLTRSFRLKEGTLLRLSVSVIGGFILSVYKILLLGFGKAEILYSVFMIFVTPVCSFVFVTLFESGFTLDDTAKRLRQIISLRGRDEGERVRRIAFFSAILITAFFISLSLKPFELFGISLSYIFAATSSLVISRRAGALIGSAIAFAAALPLSVVSAAAFALSALASGALFSIGLPYALLGGVAALSLFSGLAEGLSGFLSVFPEYVIGAALCYPLLKISSPEAAHDGAVSQASVKDMVGTMALAYQSRYRGKAEALDSALTEAARVISSHRESEEELRRALSEAFARELKYAAVLVGKEVAEEEVEALSEQMARDGCASRGKEIAELFGDMPCVLDLSQRLMLAERAVSEKRRSGSLFSEALSCASTMLRSALEEDETERGVDRRDEEKLTEVLTKAGLDGGAVCALGDRKKHLIIAGVDPTGTLITDPAIKRSLEEILLRPLGSQEYYRRDSAALMECSARPRLALEHATSSYSHEGDISGDVFAFAEASDGRLYAMISDGMGTGESAGEVSSLVSGVISSLVRAGVAPSHVLRLINSIILARGSEISATVDIFELDAMCGEAAFIKCGAAVSYVKRDSSIFRIRSRTAPIGILPSPDAERVAVEIREGDIIVMLSDGVNPTADDAPWLLDLLSRSDGRDLKALANSIIDTAKRRTAARDDMTAVVLRVVET